MKGRPEIRILNPPDAVLKALNKLAKKEQRTNSKQALIILESVLIKKKEK